MGSEAMCRGVISPTLPKTQYKFTLLHPVPETNSSHVIGESTLTWVWRELYRQLGKTLFTPSGDGMIAVTIEQT